MIAADLPSSSRAHVNYATALQEAGQADQAAEEFSTALRFNPDSAKTHVSLATVLMGKGNLEEAQTHFDEALRIDPNNAEYHSGHVYLLEQLGRIEEAAAESEAAVRLAPKLAILSFLRKRPSRISDQSVLSIARAQRAYCSRDR